MISVFLWKASAKLGSPITSISSIRRLEVSKGYGFLKIRKITERAILMNVFIRNSELDF